MASNYHLGYKTNVVRTVSGQEVALSGTGGDSNNIEIDDLYQGVVFNLPIGKNPPDEIYGEWHQIADIMAINDAKVGQRYKYVTSNGEVTQYRIIEVTSLQNGKINGIINFNITHVNLLEQ